MSRLYEVPRILADHLTQNGIAADVKFSGSPARPFQGPAAAVSLQSVQVTPLSMGDYLGEEYLPQTQRTVEVYARRCALTAAIEVYAAKEQGEAVLEEACAQIFRLLEGGSVLNLAFGKYSRGQTRFQQDSGLFFTEITLELAGTIKTLFDEETGEFSDFDIRGQLT